MVLRVVILAAGKGERMVSGISKMLHSIGGISLLERVVRTTQLLKAHTIYVVYGNGGSLVREKLNHLPVHWVKQNEQLGTGHAVLQVIPFCNDNDQVLVLYGDVPLISVKTLQALLDSTPSSGLGLVIAELPDSVSTGLGRIIRNKFGSIISVIEHKDADKQQLKIREIHTGIMTTSSTNLKKWLPTIGNNNLQKEYYLTDTVAAAVAEGCPVGSVMAHCFEEVQGVNNRWDLGKLERYFQQSMAKKLSLSGATIIDPNRIDIRGDDVHVGHDVIIDINVILEGTILLGRNVRIGPNVLLKNVTIDENTEILANSVIENTIIGAQCSVGPFARIRPGSVLEEGTKVGNFVEMKQSTLGKGSKANHLTYLGDATIGKNVNIGAGTIICNYDGTNKWPTKIEDDAFIGSNVVLVAPVVIGENATIGAGSIITQNVLSNHLTLARERQRTIKNWRHSKKKKKQKEE
ncbi:bifunctional UDP-N-acetylglucosamine diphosphorylase/glucosamine-1-phosphate N-acetyltransferase GlmU [Coxiella endosymbiont of Amblyomma nuttalli]|uniref:bifunctional UDP-N-acetylglucosamine diphosphorylase/glucosamine-1-phosphate N-acetyltransferase GlmU n=1 Tax=Coxiella endosymbiont of Amblyomma nuttalli TaxID=2749996 RepID=UPI001BA6362E|nr:bifunctional UDP-N-acetylglucosamine diphosphorylase/glucosamine-1-phosphate N-acetyltransferase GlmU [Coxiella endosymbiont of Amblyomma nuttalli]QTS84232.1 Bifunctional protein GlmU [Coxiella endosymbiont of Amblyomma nuttalli]